MRKTISEKVWIQAPYSKEAHPLVSAMEGHLLVSAIKQEGYCFVVLLRRILEEKGIYAYSGRAKNLLQIKSSNSYWSG